jgi:ribonucleoside-triphosphate reductase
MVSTRAQIITRRTYNRPLNEEGTIFETWEDTINRVTNHQQWLWERALTHSNIPEMPLHDITEDMQEWVSLSNEQVTELMELRDLMLERKVCVAGRTLWLGGTPIGKSVELSQFNCAFIKVTTVHDIVDLFWGLLNGAGVTGLPEVGTLTGFREHIPNIRIIRTTRAPTDKGPENNLESWDPDSNTWTIKVGDSARAWAKSIGKLLACKYPAKTLVLDFTQIRGAGARLRNYGWLSQSDTGLATAYLEIFNILNAKADSLLTEIDIGDIINLLGTVLSTRRAAESLLMSRENPRWKEFVNLKADIKSNGKYHRHQSNNSLLFFNKPSHEELTSIFGMLNKGGNGEPGFVNAQHMLARAPWAKGLNPCYEILLPDGGTCNLVTIDVSKFKSNMQGLLRATEVVARANYRQTIVDFNDGILQEKWNLSNAHLHLCGVSLMGIAMRPDMLAYEYTRIERIATFATYTMAKELGTPLPKNVSALKPEGTISKCFDSTEGVHTPLGRYLFNNVSFGIHDPLIPILRSANYKVTTHPTDPGAVIIALPVKYDGVEFTEVNGVELNLESAITQLERYKMLMSSYCHQNVSCTISYSIDETEEIVDWLFHNWDNYVAVSFLFRNDHTKTAEDLGYAYLPQQIVTKETYDKYVLQLLEIDLDSVNSDAEISGNECSTGSCPIR